MKAAWPGFGLPFGCVAGQLANQTPIEAIGWPR